MKFSDYLRDQVDRQDAVGALARKAVYEKRRVGGYKQIKTFLIERGAGDQLHKGLEAAADEFALLIDRARRTL